jgi:hypothetical protein
MTDSVKVVLNSQINVGADRKKLLYVSGTQKTYNNPAANGSITGGQVLFSNVALPSLSNSLISRNMRVRYQIQIVATSQAVYNDLALPNPNLPYLGGTAGSVYPQIPGGALRPFPLSTCTDSCILTINNVPTAVNLRQVLPAILRTVPKEYLEKQATECPSMLDNAPCLVADSNFGFQGSTYAGQLISSQPLSNRYNSTYMASRGAFQPISYTVAGTTTTIVYEVAEPVFVSPLSLYDETEFLANVNTFSLQYNYSLLQDALIMGGVFYNTSNGQPFRLPAGYSCSLVPDSARLEYELISLDTRVVAVPRVVSYPYSVPNFYPKQIGTLAAPITNNVQVITQAQSDTLRLSFMPSLVYVYAHIPVPIRAVNNVATAFSFSDCNLSLGTAAQVLYNPAGVNNLIYDQNQTGVISVTLNNRQGLLQGASIKDLYRVAVRRGYPYSYQNWVNNPVIIFSPVEDLGVDLSQSDIYSGMNGNVTLQISASFNNFNYVSQAVDMYGGSGPPGIAGYGAATTWGSLGPVGGTLATTPINLDIVCIQSGVAEISPDTMVINTGAISAMEVKQALGQASRGETDSYLPSHLTKVVPQGGSISDMFGDVKNVVSSVAKGIGAVQSDPLFQKALKMAQSL